MKKKILILANKASGLYDFRNELLLRLLEEYEVHVSLPDAGEVPGLEEEGCIIHPISLERRGMNPVKDSKLMRNYYRLLKEVKPEVVLTYTIKPNIYGSLACRLRKIPYIASITGLGSAFEKEGILKTMVVFLYRMALKNAHCVFFQNRRNKEIFAELGIEGQTSRQVPGSGVNLDRHCKEDYPSEDAPVKLVYVGRIMKEKGMDELLYTAERICAEYENTEFELIGYYEDDYKEVVEEKQRQGILHLIPYQKDIHPYYTEASAVLMPSYHEGMSNVILEAAATGRPVLASRIPGCKEGFDEGFTGIGFTAGDKESLYEAVKQFMELPYEERKAMGERGRLKMEQEFDRKLVVKAYMEVIHRAMDDL